MLRRLSIANYLLIEELELDLEKGLTIVTGETGSGKSILIGALALAMGERAEAAALRDATKRCVIELEVDVAELDLAAWFAANELPFEPRTILRRQLDPGGRSRAFVNDTPVRSEQLRELGGRLVHVHSQHHTLLLNDAQFQLGLVDHVAGHVAAVAEYAEHYQVLKERQRELASLREEEARSSAELDYLRFQLVELDEAALKADEQALLEQDLSRADHAEELISALRSVEDGIAAERGVLTTLAHLKHVLTKPARFDPAVQALLDRVNSAHIELKDIGDEAATHADRVTLDPKEATRLRERLDLILRLQQKHRVVSNEALLVIADDLRQRTGHIGSLAERIVVLERDEAVLSAAVLERAKAISRGRTKAVKPLANSVETILQELGMPHAVFQFDHRTGVLGPQGMDTVRALFTANKDRAPAPLDKVASGGELSRVMLALISLAADSRALPSVIFDEIDTGVSGEVADRVGGLMARMGKQRQVLAITHLPQIASKAQHHLLVTKNDEGGVVRTRITPLDSERRVEAIAQMLSGRQLTKAALENARVLLKG